MKARSTNDDKTFLQGPGWMTRVLDYRVEQPRSRVPRGMRGLIVEQPQATRVFCTIERRSPEADAIVKLLKNDIFHAPFFLISTWPRSRPSRTKPGAWRVKRGGPTRTYRTKALAQRAATKRGRDSSQHELYLIGLEEEFVMTDEREDERPMIVELASSTTLPSSLFDR